MMSADPSIALVLLLAAFGALGGIGVAALASWIGRRLRARSRTRPRRRHPYRRWLARCYVCGTRWTAKDPRVARAGACPQCRNVAYTYEEQL